MPDFKTTIETLKKALQTTPKNTELRLYLGKLFEENELHKEAADEYVKVLSIDPKDEAAMLGLGRSLYKLKDYEAARKTLQKVHNAESYLYLARVLLEQEDKDGAETYYRKAIEEDPSLKHDDLEKKFRGQPIKIGDYGEREYEFEKVKSDITFKDIGGLEKLKNEIRLKIVQPYEKKHIFAAYGKKAGGGLLLYGPPGCGKTLIAKATAGEIKANFMSLELSEILDMWRGESEKKLSAFFKEARAHVPTIVFIDEVDALGAARERFGAAEMKSLVNQLLAELDGIGKDNSQILVIAATNMPWQLDSAFKRPGRFDKTIFVPPPDIQARIDILKIYAKDKPKKQLDYEKLASLMTNFSGADIKRVVEQAVENTLPKALEDNMIIPLTTEAIEEALEEVQPSTLEWFHTVKNYIKYANQDGTYDSVKAYMNKELKNW